MALRSALRDAALYRAVPGYEAPGAITVSVFVVRDQREAEILTEGIGQSRYGLATAGALRVLGYGVVGTDVEEDGVPIPFCERHADVIVSAYPEHEVPYSDRLSPAVRRAIRASRRAW